MTHDPLAGDPDPWPTGCLGLLVATVVLLGLVLWACTARMAGG